MINNVKKMVRERHLPVDIFVEEMSTDVSQVGVVLFPFFKTFFTKLLINILGNLPSVCV